jgi:hypothetical protein
MDLSIFESIDQSNRFRIEHEKVVYQAVFPFPLRKCAVHLKNRRKAALNGSLKEDEALNSKCVADDLTSYLKNSNTLKDLTLFQHQDVPAYMMALQAKAILNFPFMRHVRKQCKALSGYRLQRYIMMAILKTCCAICPDHIVLGHGTYPEIRLAAAAFASDIGYFNLYDVLGEGYPIYHAEMTRRIPVYIDERTDELLEAKAGKIDSPVEHLIWGKERRFAGLYPVIEVPEAYLSADSAWVSQDQLARKDICRKIVDDAMMVLRKDPEKPVYIIDFGGGVGNLSEVLLKIIYTMPESEAPTRELLKKKVRIIVRDLSKQQIQGGIKRFSRMVSSMNGSGLDLSKILENICFLVSDITKEMESPDQVDSDGKTPAEMLKSKWLDFDLTGSFVIGMCAYALGAIPAAAMKEAAIEVNRLCTKFYAVDFSSPMWRPQAFLNDTGAMGRSYLRALHGKTDSLLDAVLNPIVKFMALSPGLAGQYATWKGADGHNAGYTIESDGSLIPPNILSFARKMQLLAGKKIYYKSKVRFYTFLYLGHTVSKNVALACVPGWVADYLVAE